MTEYTRDISEPWFTLIKLGIKKCEGRIKKNDFAKMVKGDIIKFTNEDFGSIRSYSVKITSIHTYNTFKDYLLNENQKNKYVNYFNLNKNLHCHNLILHANAQQLCYIYLHQPL